MSSQKLRTFIVAPKKKLLISCDLSQAETWVVAYLAREETMKWALLNSDIHYETGNTIYHKDWDSASVDTKKERLNYFKTIITSDERFTSKKTNHGKSYRMTPSKFVQAFNAESPIPITIYEAREHDELWHSKYYNIKLWWSEIDTQLLSNRTFVTPYGRKRTFYGKFDDELKKQVTAHLPQSTVADHFNGFIQHDGANVKGGLKEVYHRFKFNKEIKIINQSHDSCMLEVPKEVRLEVGQEVKSILYRPIVINGELCNIPVDLEIGERWGNLDKVN